MNPTRRSIVFAVITALSAAGLALVLAMWFSNPRGYNRGPGLIDTGAVGTPNTSWFFASAAGSVRIMRQRVTSSAGTSLRLTADGARLGFITLRHDGNIISRTAHGVLEPGHWWFGFGSDQHRYAINPMLYAPERISGSFTLEYTVTAIPYWPAAMLLAIAPVVWLRRRIVYHHRMNRGLCLQCGYDLAFSPDRCPECGATPDAAAQEL